MASERRPQGFLVDTALVKRVKVASAAREIGMGEYVEEAILAHLDGAKYFPYQNRELHDLFESLLNSASNDERKCVVGTISILAEALRRRRR